ncbi:hypothetical protein BT69DRAFT_1293772 [Atractiella rhizophila]|nr:hypothetical protein BT69DRAFT_1293772 [Atractiella rhizophila]
MAVSLPTDIVGLICYHLYRLALPTANQGIDPTLVPIQPKIAVHSPNGRLPLATEFAPSDFEVVKRTFRHLTELGSRVWFLEARKYQWEFLSFSEFRSHGLGRSVGQGNTERFVTPTNLLKLLKSTRGGKRLVKPEAVWELDGLEEEDEGEEEEDDEEAKEFVVRPGSLSAVAFSEYMDSSITFPVLSELLLRGGYVAEYRRLTSRTATPPPLSPNTPPTTPSPPPSELPERRGRSRTRHPSSTSTPQRPSLSRSLSGGSSIFHSPESRRRSLETWSKSRSRSRFNESPYRSSIAVSRNMGREDGMTMESHVERADFVQAVEGSTEIRPLDALDLMGCVSERFVEGLRVFVERYNLMGNVHALLSKDGKNRTLVLVDQKVEDLKEEFKLNRILFPHLRRLGLFNCLLSPDLLVPFVASFPELTHLDLCNTRANRQLLKCLARQGEGKGKMRLEVLSLSRCRNVDSTSLKGLLVGDLEERKNVLEEPEDVEWGEGLTCSRLTDFALFGDPQTPSPLAHNELAAIIDRSPMLSSSLLRRLDLSSAPLTDELLAALPTLPSLLELGLAHCRNITLRGVASYLVNSAPGVEVLNLNGSCPMLIPPIGTNAARRGLGNDRGMDVLALFTQLIKEAATPRSRPLLDYLNPKADRDDLEGRKTHLRVIELDKATLTSIRGGPPTWKVIWGKGRRGWLVDISVAGIDGPEGRYLVPLKEDDERRIALLSLSALNGNVPTTTGWYSQKPELLDGLGFLGRESGMFAYHAYAN